MPLVTEVLARKPPVFWCSGGVTGHGAPPQAAAASDKPRPRPMHYTAVYSLICKTGIRGTFVHSFRSAFQ
eukprot:SAG22_NODE_512_length_9579_cov_27.293143_5_plen_70_part_00